MITCEKDYREFCKHAKVINQGQWKAKMDENGKTFWANNVLGITISEGTERVLSDYEKYELLKKAALKHDINVDDITKNFKF
ncbi:hypothetical protein [Paraprevotella clara]|uniref:hypothetical protein n=1 Tax=Paraprevotella clara TaxID=454154 RepID=UPI003AB1FC72